MSKTKVVLASVLKPVDDSRTYEKIGYSMSQTKKYEVNIIGFRSKNNNPIANIIWHPIFCFNRLSLKRLFAPLKCLKLLVQLKPSIIIFSTHELIWICLMYKLFWGGKLCYDVQENYYRNILYGKSFPILIKHILAYYVRFKEYLSSAVIDHYFLAEKAYANELSFCRGRSTVLQNKFNNIYNIKKRKSTDFNRLVFTGTIAETTGIFSAIELAIKLRYARPTISFKIIGKVTQKSILKKLKEVIRLNPWISLVGGEDLVDHSKIVNAISNADLALVSYLKNRSTESSIPTKIYEYLAIQLPFLMVANPLWEKVCSPYNACLVTDFKKVDAEELWSKLVSFPFYSKTPGSEVLWVSEEEKLIQSMNDYLHK
ncbi:MAG: hypothetical protein AAF843_17910 [Bacteroidota bacterium]